MTDTTAATSTGHPIQDAHRSYAAAHHAKHDVSSLREFRFAVDHLRLEYTDFIRLLRHAEAAKCERAPVVRAHLPLLRRLRDEAAALVAEAEAA